MANKKGGTNIGHYLAMSLVKESESERLRKSMLFLDS